MSNPHAYPGTTSPRRITVVVPVKNGQATIERCLRAVCNQQWNGGDLEIIVVDNGSTDQTPSIVSSKFPQVRLLFEKQPGVSHARNLAIEKATGEWIAFTDADCIPTSNWLQNLADRAQEAQEVSFVGGPIRPLLPTTKIGLFAENLFDQQRSIERETPPSFISANLLARRKDLVQFGMFNPNFPRGQDTELAWRSHFRHGAQFAYAPEAAVEHANESTWTGLIKKAWQHGSGSARLLREFQVELNAQPKKRCWETKFYKEFLRALGLRIGHPFVYRKLYTKDEVTNRFYFAAFRLVRHLSFVFHTIRNPDRNTK